MRALEILEIQTRNLRNLNKVQMHCLVLFHYFSSYLDTHKGGCVKSLHKKGKTLLKI